MRLKTYLIIILLSFPLFAEYSITGTKGEEIVTDSKTNLQWTKEYVAPLTRDDALKHCENLNYGEFSDWRLPTFEELKSLLNRRAYAPASTFPDMPNGDFWSSSISHKKSLYSDKTYTIKHSVGFAFGGSLKPIPYGYGFARCVKNEC